jgi:hypothetical protein
MIHAIGALRWIFPNEAESVLACCVQRVFCLPPARERPKSVYAGVEESVRTTCERPKSVYADAEESVRIR